MTNIARVKVDLTGWTGGPGVNVLHFSQGTNVSWTDEVAQDLVDEVRTSFYAARDTIAPGVIATVDPTVSLIDVANGDLVGIISAATPPAQVTGGSAAGQENRASQILVQLRTGYFLNGRELRGRMFLGPMGSDSLTATGTVDGAVQGIVASAFSGLVTGGGINWCVWHRPTSDVANDGTWKDVTTIGVSAQPAILRKRRS